MARRMVPAARNEAENGDPAVTFLAEKLIALAAGATFTNDRYPRATEPDLSRLRPSEPTGSTLPTLVREGASIGAPSRSVKEPAKPLNPCTTSS